MDWGDGQTEHLTHNAQASLPGPSTPAGTYPLFSKHSYEKAGDYKATATLQVHCFNATPGKGTYDIESFDIHVYDRVDLKSFTISPVRVKRDATITLTSGIDPNALICNTRVDFATEKKGVFGADALNDYADIPFKSNSFSKALKVAKDAPLGEVEISAKAGSTIKKSITIIR